MLHVYFMPGLAASSSIFENIKLPKEVFKIHLLEWLIPFKNESLEDYAKRMNLVIEHENIILVGVSFGGILVQEMAKYKKVKKLVIISSIKSREEMPLRLKLINSTMAYKLLPYSMVAKIDKWSKYAFGSNFIANRLRMYDKYLNVRDTVYLEWAIRNVVSWKESQPIQNVTHIHGEDDEIFPSKNIKDYIQVPKGTHVMIVLKYHWMNENLPNILQD